MLALSNFVDKFYEMDPITEDLLFDGTMLENGMVVLMGDALNREDLEGVMTTEQQENARRFNRWCTVSRVEIVGDRVLFLATYDDHTKRKIIMRTWYPWLVKLHSIPSPLVYKDESSATFHSSASTSFLEPIDVPWTPGDKDAKTRKN